MRFFNEKKIAVTCEEVIKMCKHSKHDANAENMHKICSLVPSKNCQQRKLRQIKFLLFNFGMIKLTKIIILANCQVLNGFL